MEKKYSLLFILIFNYILLAMTQEHECGRTKYSAGLIVNGDEAKRGEFPFSVALLKLDEDEKYFCGSCLITKKHTLTASHCIQQKDSAKKLQPKEIIAILGKHNLKSIYEKDVQQIEINKITIHEDWRYSDRSYDGDIAILTFEKEAILNDFVQIVCLPQSIDYSLQSGVIVGWGVSENSNYKDPEPKPRKTNIKTPPSNADCFLKNPDITKISSNRTYCAGGESAGPCFGDSGGGFFVSRDGVWYLQGIISATIITNQKQCDVETYAVYTNVALFVDWIWSSIKGYKPLNIDCQFKHSENLKGKPYYCDAKPKVFTDDFTVASVSGRHLNGKSDKDVAVINLSGKNEVLELHYVPKGIGDRFVNLKTLFIQNCQLKSLSRKSFLNMDNVATISLTNNHINTIDEDTFYNLTNLQSLRLNGNRLKSIPINLLIHAKNLQHFILGRNLLESFDQNVFENNIHLTTLDLSENKLKKIKFDLSSFPELQIAAFDGNACVDERFVRRTPKKLEKLQDIINKKCS